MAPARPGRGVQARPALNTAEARRRHGGDSLAYQSTNPCDGKVLKIFCGISDKDLKFKLKAAQECFRQVWRNKSFAQRQTALSRAAGLMRERSQELAELITLELGKLIPQSLGKVASSAAILDYYANKA